MNGFEEIRKKLDSVTTAEQFREVSKELTNFLNEQIKKVQYEQQARTTQC